jgi:hypothetical protein
MKLKAIETTHDGRDILAVHQVQQPGKQHLQVVLCWWHGQYVTWINNTSREGFSSGNYFNPQYEYNGDFEACYRDAVLDFQRRVRREEHFKPRREE